MSKFLKYAPDPLTAEPVWNHLLQQPPQQEAGPELLLDQAVGVNGKLSKLEAALKFLRATTYKLDSDAYKESLYMSEVMLGCTWRKNKSIKRAVRQEMISTDGLEMDDFLFVDTCDKGLPITDKLMDECSTIISIPLTFRSWQRPGAVNNCLLAQDQRTLYVIKSSGRGPVRPSTSALSRLTLSGGHNFNKFNQRSKQIFHHFGYEIS